jgi:hypothetical protein
VPVLAAGLLLDARALAWSGAGAIEAGVACFLLQARRFYRARLRRRLDAGLRSAAVALGFLGGAALLAPAVLAAGSSHPRLATAYGVVGVLGAFALYVAALSYKIVPFLAWLRRFRDRMGREQVPAVADLYSADVARWQLGLMSAGVGGLAVAVVLGSAAGARGAAAAFALGAAVHAAQMLRAAVGTPRAASQPLMDATAGAARHG